MITDAVVVNFCYAYNLTDVQDVKKLIRAK